MGLPFDGLISRVAIMTKEPLHDSEPTIKIYEKISFIIVVKSKIMVGKKRSHSKESIFSQTKTPKIPYSLL
jgi:hypothetical protein